ncbi:glutamate--tRNA ligase [Sphingosinicella ginsenosidimutans]|uniref:glutamate--tRNA ligase n=1 Tax=Allosphingosinicella ginsenosidimutans TaxID=1176539 RepID=UPI001FB05ECA|nr:glutamate--tRNA ligase [Sphingosinicella ginsenosidimutans]
MSASPQAIVTRFAPSPTGFLHIGGARTALFNWLYARRFGGRFVLRIEDTDKARSTQAAIDAILDGMTWLGLDWDGDAWFQSHFAARHAEVARALLESGHAYRCWMTQEELAAQREAAQKERRPFRIRSPWRDRDDGPADQPFVVRLRAPQEGETSIDDAVQGRVTVRNEEIDDFVLLRSDGTPTYMLAVVVDDHDMGVTHVIRGDDHLNNAFRQIAIIRAMGWPVPTYGHVPLIHGADGAKLSKRHGALGVETYRDELGMLPEALFNYLLRLGWGHGDAEIISREEAIQWFDLPQVGRAPARFDMKKLENLNGHYLRAADPRRIASLIDHRIEGALGRGLDAGDIDLLTRAMPVLTPRAKDLNELAEAAQFLFKLRPLDVDEKAAALLEGAARDLLALVHESLQKLDTWTVEATEQAVREVSEAEGVKLGQVAQPLRAALTGRATSPGIFDVLALLGRDESLARIGDQMTGKGK